MPRPGKIQELESLAATLQTLRAEGKRIVHCHGVFDLMHIGHIRHFEQAKNFGDVLVVTVTPDRYVNKGPHRPVFTESLRIEAIASLDSVDFVAINQWPMAIDTIRLLQPDFYVKGSDYRDANGDVTGGIALEQEAVESGGGQLVFTDDITFSSSNLLNKHMAVFPQETTDYLAGFAVRHSPAEVMRYLNGAQPLKVLVVGEAIIDEYQYCEAIGKSSKEPMLAVRLSSTEKFAGGILAVGNHVSSFCDHAGMVTMLGTENSHEEFIRHKLKENITPRFVYQTDAPTIVKRRFVESYFFTKLLAVYEMNPEVLEAQDNVALCQALEEELPQYDVVIVVDFGHGMLSREAIEILCSKARFLAVNSQSNAGNMGYHTISRYPRADYVCIAENEMRLEARDRQGDLREMILTVAEKLGCRYMTVTRGKRGSLCYSRDEGFYEIPSLTSHVVDRMGAGDAFLSISALCVAQNAPAEVAGFIGNAVGAHAVATVGNRSAVERVALMKHIESLLK